LKEFLEDYDDDKDDSKFYKVATFYNSRFVTDGGSE
jgi:hypothetical protein